jgi:hypothetical protein
VNPYSGGLPKGGPKASATFVREDELEQEKKARPFPAQARKLYWFAYAPALLFISVLPVALEASGVQLHIGPWLALLITIPCTVLSMFFVGFLREGMMGNFVYASVALFALTMGYSLDFGVDADATSRALLMRSVSPVIVAVMLFFLWRDLQTHLREWHYRVASGESWQDIMAQMQQANVIQKAGGKPALDAEGNVVDAEEVIGRPGFRQKPRKGKGEGKRKKPKLR